MIASCRLRDSIELPSEFGTFQCRRLPCADRFARRLPEHHARLADCCSVVQTNSEDVFATAVETRADVRIPILAAVVVARLIPQLPIQHRLQRLLGYGRPAHWLRRAGDDILAHGRIGERVAPVDELSLLPFGEFV